MKIKLYEIEFKPLYLVGGVCIIAAENEEQALAKAQETIKHTEIKCVREMYISSPKVLSYVSGDY